MSEKQISKLAGTLTEHQHHFGALSVEDREYVIRNTPEAIGLFVEAVKNRATTEVKLLKFVRTILLPAIPEFVVADKLRTGETVEGIKVGWLGDNIKKHFLKKIERNKIAAEGLKVGQLLKNSSNPAIITEFGGEEKVEVNFGQFWEFLKTADQNFWYVAYIRDTEGVLWTVDCHWYSDGLSVGAGPLDDPRDWGTDFRFLSR